mmetsp:Transcript_21599/g.29732  ORF Transcript_21599/g.29732 Transcript_21599/m.29732 type:complete len:319 (+) Transcript_21599:235-1191(+)
MNFLISRMRRSKMDRMSCFSTIATGGLSTLLHLFGRFSLLELFRICCWIACGRIFNGVGTADPLLPLLVSHRLLLLLMLPLWLWSLILALPLTELVGTGLFTLLLLLLLCEVGWLQASIAACRALLRRSEPSPAESFCKLSSTASTTRPSCPRSTREVGAAVVVDRSEPATLPSSPPISSPTTWWVVEGSGAVAAWVARKGRLSRPCGPLMEARCLGSCCRQARTDSTSCESTGRVSSAVTATVGGYWMRCSGLGMAASFCTVVSAAKGGRPYPSWNRIQPSDHTSLGLPSRILLVLAAELKELSSSQQAGAMASGAM